MIQFSERYPVVMILPLKTILRNLLLMVNFFVFYMYQKKNKLTNHKKHILNILAHALLFGYDQKLSCFLPLRKGSN